MLCKEIKLFLTLKFGGKSSFNTHFLLVMLLILFSVRPKRRNTFFFQVCYNRLQLFTYTNLISKLNGDAHFLYFQNENYLFGEFRKKNIKLFSEAAS